MSYDLFFYTSKKQPVSWEQISAYLTDHIGADEHGQWVYENNDTNVYFILEKTSPTDEDDQIVFDGFDSVELGFILNFIRPTFFGIEAFLFVEQMTKDLGLYVLNPQQEFGELTQPAKEVLFENWNKTNAWAFKDNMDDETVYVDRDVSTTVWNYNFHRKKLQDEVGENYYVSRMFIFQRTADKKLLPFLCGRSIFQIFCLTQITITWDVSIKSYLGILKTACYYPKKNLTGY